MTAARLKRGAVRADGVLVLHNLEAGERWVTRERYEIKMAANRARARTKSAAIKEATARARRDLTARLVVTGRRTHGEIHPGTGKVFWGYQPHCKDGEQWMTAEKFATTKARQKRWEKELPTSSPRRQRHRDPAYRARANACARKSQSLPHVKARNAAKARRMRASNPMHALACRCRIRLLAFLRSRGLRKNKKTAEFIGCSWELLRDHIARQFVGGMSWDNRELWHVDHIIPLASAITEEDILELCHYTNLQPLWAADNLSKGANYLPK